MAPQVLLCSRIRDATSREIGATRHYKHSSSVSAWFDVRTVVETLLKNQVFTLMPGRLLPPKSASPSEICDIYLKGMGQIWEGSGIHQYVEKRQQTAQDDPDPGDDGPCGPELELDRLDGGEDDGDVLQEMMEEIMEGLL